MKFKRLNRHLEDCLFIVSGEGYTEYDYLNIIKYLFNCNKIKVVPVEPSNKSSPLDVVERLKEFINDNKENFHLQSYDKKWILLDVDHHYNNTHQCNLSEALKQARQAGYEVAISNPRFDFWLLSHFLRVDESISDIENKIKDYLPGYCKRIPAGAITQEQVYTASSNCAGFKFHPGNKSVRGSEVYKLIEEIKSTLEPWL